MVRRIEHILVEGTCTSVSVASSPPAWPSPLCRSVHRGSPTAFHPATVPPNGPGLSGERARRHSSCACHPPETSLTSHVHVTRVAPTGHDAAASVAAGAEENADDDGDDVPDLAPSCYDVPPGTTLFPPEVATPHAPLSLPAGGVLTTALGIDRPLVLNPRRRAAEHRNTRLAALHERLTPIHDGAALPRSSAPGHDAETLGAYCPYVDDEAETFPPQQLSWEVILTATVGAPTPRAGCRSSRAPLRGSRNLADVVASGALEEWRSSSSRLGRRPPLQCRSTKEADHGHVYQSVEIH